MSRNRKCAICQDPIPKKNQLALMDMGYSGIVDGFTHISHIFCPKHDGVEVARYICTNNIGMKGNLKKIKKILGCEETGAS